MNAARANAYAEVMSALRIFGPEKLFDDERQWLRNAADAFVLARGSDDVELVAALAALMALVDRLGARGRWKASQLRWLIEDVLACGPAPGVHVPALDDSQLTTSRTGSHAGPAGPREAARPAGARVCPAPRAPCGRRFPPRGRTR